MPSNVASIHILENVAAPCEELHLQVHKHAQDYLLCCFRALKRG